jgi:hypothetical protein
MNFNFSKSIEKTLFLHNKYNIRMKISFPISTAISLFTVLLSCNAQGLNKKSISLDNVKENGLKLEIPDSSLQTLLAVRDKAIKSKILKDKKSFVNAKLSCGDETIKASVRFKGDHTDHLEGNRWSFRVITKKKGLVFGENKFSIQGVHTRAFVSEWVFHKLLEKEGLVYLQYHFIPFQINDIDSLKGIYAYESHFKTNLLKIQNKKPGPIAKISEDLFWNQEHRKGETDRDSSILTESKIILTAKKGFDKSLKALLKKNLDDYRKGLVTADKVMDIDKWAKFVAINGLMRSNHALRWHNLRFYLNPDSKLIEPVGFDCVSWHSSKPGWFLDINKMEAFYNGLFKSETFIDALYKKTNEISERSYFKEFLDDNKTELDENIKLIQLEKKKYKFWPSTYYKSQDLIKAALAAQEK